MEFEYLSADGQKVLFKQLAPEMIVPGRPDGPPVLHSPDVNHAFYVPQFLFKRDVVPGRENNSTSRSTRPMAGQTFRGQCAELCGTFHGAMLFTVKAMTPADYDAWLRSSSRSPRRASAGAAAGARRARLGGRRPGPARPGAPKDSPASTQNIALDGARAEADARSSSSSQNNDAGVPHNVAIHGRPNAAIRAVRRARSSTASTSRTYPIPALKAGTYAFSCKVHPNMTGTLTVQ